jgi:hypothetical protein
MVPISSYVGITLALVISPFAASAPRTVGLLSGTDINQIVGAVLARKEVAMYLHPDVPGRLPVKVAVASPYSDVSVDLVFYGKPVKILSYSADAVNMAISSSAEGVTVTVSYRPEGMAGTVKLKRRQAHWTVIDADIYEH